MDYVKTELQVYLDYEGKKLKEYSDLLTKYNDLESKRSIHITNNAPKVLKKEKLLALKKDGITSKIDDIELQKIEDDENAERVRDNLLKQIEDKKRRLLEEIESSIQYAHRQYDSMIAKNNTVYKKKKSILESRGQFVSSELDIITEVKSAPEVTIDKQQATLLPQMQLILEAVKSSRNRLVPINKQDKLPPLPSLPKEPISTPSVPTPSVPTPSISYITPDELELEGMRNAARREIQQREAKEELARLSRQEKQQMAYESGKQEYAEQLKKLGIKEETQNQEEIEKQLQEQYKQLQEQLQKPPLEQEKQEEQSDDGWNSEDEREAKEAERKAREAREKKKQPLYQPPPLEEPQHPPILSNTKMKRPLKVALKR